MDEKIKTILKIFFIYGALENGWTVRKSKTVTNGFEFTTESYYKTPVRKRSMSTPIMVSDTLN